jgi:hypothetical protein
MGVDRARALEAIVRAALIDGAHVARRTLRVMRVAATSTRQSRNPTAGSMFSKPTKSTARRASRSIP